MTPYIKIPDDFAADKRLNMANSLSVWDLYSTRLDGDKILLESSNQSDLFYWDGYLDANSSLAEIVGLCSRIKRWDGGPSHLPIGAKADFEKKFEEIANPTLTRTELSKFIITIRNFVGLSDANELPAVLVRVQKKMAEFFPDFKIILISKDIRFARMSRAASVFSAASYLTAQEIDSLISEKPGGRGINSFEGGHMLLNRDFFSPLLAFIPPFVSGFTVNWLSYELIFLFGGPIKTNAPEVEKVLYGIGSEMWGHPKNTNPAAVVLGGDRTVSLLQWYVKKINVFFNFIFDARNFADRDSGEVQTSKHYQTILTVDALGEIFVRINASTDSVTQKILMFQFLDRYIKLLRKNQLEDVLSERFFERNILGIFKDMHPPGFKREFVEFFDKERKALIEQILDGVHVPGRRQADAILTGRERNNSVPLERYALGVLDCLRDTTHGYALDKDRFEKYLSIHDGRISNVFQMLVVPLYLALVAQPDLLTSRR